MADQSMPEKDLTHKYPLPATPWGTLILLPDQTIFFHHLQINPLHWRSQYKHVEGAVARVAASHAPLLNVHVLVALKGVEAYPLA